MTPGQQEAEREFWQAAIRTTPSAQPEVQVDVQPVNDQRIVRTSERQNITRSDVYREEPRAFGHLSEAQFRFITTRLSADSDDETLSRLGIPAETLETWQRDAVFCQAMQAAWADDPRDTFRNLSVHLLPQALRVINDLMNSPSAKAQKEGVTLLLKAHGMLIERQQTTPPEVLEELLMRLREPRPVKILEIEPRD